MPKKSVYGFTLVELLVVVTIIAILATIGLTIYTSAQKQARDAKRRGDIDALAKAMEQNYNKINGTGNYSGMCQTGSGATYDCSKWFVGGLPEDPLKDTVPPSKGTRRYRFCRASEWPSPCTYNNDGSGIVSGNPSYSDSALNEWIFCAVLEEGNKDYCVSYRQ